MPREELPFFLTKQDNTHKLQKSKVSKKTKKSSLRCLRRLMLLKRE